MNKKEEREEKTVLLSSSSSQNSLSQLSLRSRTESQSKSRRRKSVEREKHFLLYRKMLFQVGGQGTRPTFFEMAAAQQLPSSLRAALTYSLGVSLLSLFIYPNGFPNFRFILPLFQFFFNS